MCDRDVNRVLSADSHNGIGNIPLETTLSTAAICPFICPVNSTSERHKNFRFDGSLACRTCS